MILYYSVDREILNARQAYDVGRDGIQRLEAEIESELKYLILVMPLGEQIVISPTFRFESEMCRRIIKRNYEFVENGYFVQYMKEDSIYDFRQKKAERYKYAMSLCQDYYEAYSQATYDEVKALWMPTVVKIESVGIESRMLFIRDLREIGERRKIPKPQVENVISIIRDIADEVFLWEVVEYQLIKNNIPNKLIRDLQIRQLMNRSYLNAFSDQKIHIPFNSIINYDPLKKDNCYDIWKIRCILEGLSIKRLIDILPAKSIIELHSNLELQEAFEIIRKGIVSGKEVYEICLEVKNCMNINEIINTLLDYNEEKNESYDLPRRHTLKLLHLSDLHFTDLESMEKSYRLLAIDLEVQMKVQKLNYLIISGDVCDIPSEEQYNVALKFVQQLINEFGLHIENVIIVPGNHDCSWEISKASYDNLQLANKTLWDTRFSPYDRFFYQPLFNREYPIKVEEQIEHCIDKKEKIYIAGFNSSHQIDHLNTTASAINFDAVLNERNASRQGVNDEYIKLLTWHHPIAGDGGIIDRTFLDTLAVLGYSACFHGHIHESTKDNYGYDDRHTIKMIGAGSLSATKVEREDGIPQQYNLVEIDVGLRKLIVHTRKREKADGVWMADARWGDKNGRPKAYYVVDV